MATKNKKVDTRKIAVSVEDLSKTFKIPHEKHSSLKSAALNLFNSKGYEIFKALDDVSFDVKEGEFFGIIGKNGSGKSTLLKVLAGIYVPDKKSGKITINGKLSPFLELGVGFNPELSGRENVFLGGTILGLSRKEVGEKFDKIVGFAELEEFIDMKFKNYSSGMQVRLAFALAINAHADILLMDEVLAVGDTNFQAKCLDEFKKYKKDGKTVILVTHDISTVQKYCDRVMYLQKGSVKLIDLPGKTLNEYMESNAQDEEGALSREVNVSIHSGGEKIGFSGVGLGDASGKQRRVFKTGEDLVFIAEIINKETKIGKATLGIELFDSANNLIYGYHTGMDDATRSIEKGQNKVEFLISNNNLLDGKYFINLGLADEEGRKSLDYLERACSFTILNALPKRNYSGEVDLEAKIRLA